MNFRLGYISKISIRVKTVVTLSWRLAWTILRYIGRSFGLSEAVTLNDVSPKNHRSR
ncbi:hypothetical protein [Tissierella pigra]|uniref:hypothetical protein n=1 Tax=Tissierella pigra TaxID=2607614 RepID=UPI0012B3A467|nr:hypothetical protein [Tissierella pigra]